MILIAASTKDVAGMNIAQEIIDRYKFEKLSENFQKNPIYSRKAHNIEVRLLFVNVEITNTQFIGDHFTPQLLVFVSKHKSQSAIPTLSVHTPGNLADAKLGGLPRKVSISPASAMKIALLKMAKLNKDMELNYEVSYECTHHGPSLDFPSMFTELGSSPRQWRDMKAAEIVAHAAMAAIYTKSSFSGTLGIGGPHYNMKFTRLALNTPTAFGHIIPKYAIPRMDPEMLKQCIERTAEKVDSVILDWKGIRGIYKNRLIKELEKIGMPVEKI